MELEKNKFIVFAVDHFSSLGVIRSLGEAGIRPIVILFSPCKAILVRYSKYIGILHEVKTLEEGYEILINEYTNPNKKHFLFATSDSTESYLDQHYNILKDYFYFYNAGEEGKVSHLMEKREIIELAQLAGLKTPRTEEVKLGELPKTLKYPILTKATTSTIDNWKSNVFICNNEKELIGAYSHIKCDNIILQEYVEKVDELNIEGYCINDGKEVFMPLQNRYFRITNKSYGNYAYIDQFNDDELKGKIKRLFELTHYNGIFEIEFLIDKNGVFYFLEINFRNSAWLYAYTKCGLNLPLMYAKSISTGQLFSEDENIKKLPFTLMDELTDFKWSVLNRKVSIFRWIKELIRVDCTFYFNKDDKRPFFMYLLNRIKRIFI